MEQWGSKLEGLPDTGKKQKKEKANFLFQALLESFDHQLHIKLWNMAIVAISRIPRIHGCMEREGQYTGLHLVSMFSSVSRTSANPTETDPQGDKHDSAFSAQTDVHVQQLKPLHFSEAENFKIGMKQKLCHSFSIVFMDDGSACVLFYMRWDFILEVWFCSVFFELPKPHHSRGGCHVICSQKTREPKVSEETWRFYVCNLWRVNMTQIIYSFSKHLISHGWQTNKEDVTENRLDGFPSWKRHRKTLSEPGTPDRTCRKNWEQGGSLPTESFTAAWGSSSLLAGDRAGSPAVWALCGNSSEEAHRELVTRPLWGVNPHPAGFIGTSFKL